MQPQQPSNQPIQQPQPVQSPTPNQSQSQQTYTTLTAQQQTTAKSMGSGKKALYIVGGIIIALLGLQGLIAQTIHSSHGIVTVFNLALFLLGIFLTYEPFKKK